MSTYRRSRRSGRSSSAFAVKAAELAFAAPQVVAHRLTRMAQSGQAPSAADQREMLQMGAEKLAAFNEGWAAIGMELWHMQQRNAWTLLRWYGAPWSTGAGRALWPSAAQMQQASVALLGAAMAPVHRRAVANAKRLGRSRSR